MLRRDMNVSAFDASFKVFPKVVQILRVRVPVDILAHAMIDSLVIVSSLFKSLVRLQFIRVDIRAVQNIFFNDRLQSFLGNIRDNFCHHLAVALHHAENDCLVCRAASAPAASGASADIGFINLDLAVERHFVVNLCHVIADLMTYPPCRLVSHAKLPLQFFGGYAVAGSGEKIDCQKPSLQRSPAIFKQSADSRVKVMPAQATAKSAFRFEAIPLGLLGAFRADVALAKAAIKQMHQTRFVIRELREKFFQGDSSVNSSVLFHALNIC